MVFLLSSKSKAHTLCLMARAADAVEHLQRFLWKASVESLCPPLSARRVEIRREETRRRYQIR